ncbi:MAG: SDR family oxidoreductase [Planctomycetes bacterium]|nr:SDR family oxidoreductase [Planctomycetota bacterium]
MNDLFSLAGQTIVVTGCSRGIGLGIATSLAKAGADIVGLSASLPEDGGACGATVRAAGRSFRGYRCDLSRREATRATVARILAETPRIDALIANAGTIRRKPAAEHPEAWWDEVLEVNLSSQFLISQAVGGRMLTQGRGKIVFTASLLSFQGGINVPGYAASKGGVAQLTKALANEWAGKGVNVNAIAPGYIATDNTQALRDDPERSQAILGRIPAGRWGSADDLGGAAVFLCSRASDYVNGVVLPVDGGWMGR